MFIIFLAVLFGASWYVPFRLKHLLGLATIWPWQVLAFLLLLSYPLLLMTIAASSQSRIIGVVYNLLGLWMMLYLAFCVFLLVGHLLSPLLGKVSGAWIAAVCFALSFAYVATGFIKAQSFKVIEYEIPVKGLQAGVTIVHLPDVHLGTQRGAGYLKRVVKAVNDLNPDIVLFNGDLVDANIALSKDVFAGFDALGGEKYFTSGNHEYYIDTAKTFEMINGAGIRILDNEMVETHGLQLIGLGYMNADNKTHDAHRVNDLTIEEELPKIKRDAGKPVLLAHHSPVGLSYVAAGKIDLMLSGHTHGGQIFPFTLFAKKLFPLVKGLHEIDGAKFLVSQGAGTFGPLMRLGTVNEIQLVKLIPNL